MNEINLGRVEHLFRLAKIGAYHCRPTINEEQKRDIEETLSYFQSIFNSLQHQVAPATQEPAGL